jgi:hypothetical protein
MAFTYHQYPPSKTNPGERTLAATAEIVNSKFNRNSCPTQILFPSSISSGVQ